MKLLLIILLLSAVSCSAPRYGCPKQKGKDYATVLKLILRSDGYIHSIARNDYNTYQAFYECKPDSVQVGSLVWMGNYQRISTGGRLQFSILPGIKNNRALNNL